MYFSCNIVNNAFKTEVLQYSGFKHFSPLINSLWPLICFMSNQMVQIYWPGLKITRENTWKLKIIQRKCFIEVSKVHFNNTHLNLFYWRRQSLTIYVWHVPHYCQFSNLCCNKAKLIQLHGRGHDGSNKTNYFTREVMELSPFDLRLALLFSKWVLILQN